MPDKPALARQQHGRVCKLCNNLDPRSHPATFHDQDNTSRSIARLSLRVDPVRLKRSEQNCPRCSLVAQALDAHFESWRKTKPRLLLDLVECAPLRLEVRPDVGKGENIEIYAPYDKPLPWPTLGHGQSVPKHSDSDDSFAFARQAIEACIKNHPHCRPRDDFVPTRLIDLGADPGSTSAMQLYEPPPSSKRVKYMTLSHCWGGGGGPACTTTAANLAARKRHIPPAALPPSFRDAVAVARALGVRYLWIDALCIVQDCAADWEAESARMGAVYAHAHVTVAATAAGDSDAGIFDSSSSPSRRLVRTLTYRASPRAKKVYKLRARTIPDHHPSFSSAAMATPSGPLRNRAWALQEHVLSARVLHYTAHELVFECRGGGGGARCECRQRSHKSSATSTSPLGLLLPRLLLHAATTTTTTTTTTSSGHRRRRRRKQKSRRRRAWHAIVAAYSARALSFPGDKLEAVSGMARALAEAEGEEMGSRGDDQAAAAAGGGYVAGLWREGLVGGLLWWARPPGTGSGDGDGGGEGDGDDDEMGLRPVPAVWRAPSWSWASVEGRVGYEWVEGGLFAAAEEEEGEGWGEGADGGGGAKGGGGAVSSTPSSECFASLVEIREAVAKPAGRNPLGAVSEAWIRLAGPVLGGGGTGGGVAVTLVAKPGDDGERRGELRYCLKRADGEGGGFVEMVPDSLLVAAANDDGDGDSVRRARLGEDGDVEKE
ncbi:hypothetical protein SLS58_010700 [Diplodia intermedia]|uniref:Heterokaryon incompatibility domain-containing protein n=1 Tax=Diplodia intermedia TaxID=856260 RepID=A0ABR3T4J7_9PEZI